LNTGDNKDATLKEGDKRTICVAKNKDTPFM
jgi:hypothetical protein